MLDSRRLARLCEMFRSDNEQERATAARLATKLLHSVGLSWTQLLLDQEADHVCDKDVKHRSTNSTHPSRQSHTCSRCGRSAHKVVRQVLIRLNELTAWERKFLGMLADHGSGLALTERQWVVLEDIESRLNR